MLTINKKHRIKLLKVLQRYDSPLIEHLELNYAGIRQAYLFIIGLILRTMDHNKDHNYITFDDVLIYIDNMFGGVDAIYSNYYNNLVLNGFGVLKNLYSGNDTYNLRTLILRCLFDEIARELKRDIKTKKSSTFYVFFGKPDFLYVD